MHGCLEDLGIVRGGRSSCSAPVRHDERTRLKIELSYFLAIFIVSISCDWGMSNPFVPGHCSGVDNGYRMSGGEEDLDAERGTPIILSLYSLSN